MLTCNFCGRELKNQGAKNLHERACEKNPENNEKKGDKKKGTCEHEMKVLNEKIQSQRSAIIDGYTLYCKKCGELE